MTVIDLRSDTVTLPTKDMRSVMATAEVGDDVYGEDPTINRLQDRVAELLGKEAALFVSSGTMSNQIAIRVHTVPGDEVICDYNAHVFNYESGGGAALSGIQFHTLTGRHGILTADMIRETIRPDDHHFAPTRLVTLENTHNRGGGVIYPFSEIQAIAEVTRELGIPLHLDGARLLNAAVASGIEAREWAQPFDSISLCLSKGLGAPVGSVLTGSREFIHEAHRFRKMFGGGMRQAGILAAAGLYALDHNVDRLADDHARARQLAEACEQNGLLEDALSWTHTNIVLLGFPHGDAADFAARCREEGLLVSEVNDRRLRLVTHLGIEDTDVSRAVAILNKLAG